MDVERRSTIFSINLFETQNEQAGHRSVSLCFHKKIRVHISKPIIRFICHVLIIESKNGRILAILETNNRMEAILKRIENGKK